MESGLHFNFLDQDLYLLKEKAIYWQNKQSLIVSDLHLGKVGHFRKEGLAVPIEAGNKEYDTLDSILQQYQIKRILVAGDLSHSNHNEELEQFKIWKQKYPELEILLIKGNHDILSKKFYKENNIEVVENYLICKPFVISHQPLKSAKNLYNIAGHIHPAVELTGMAKQRLTLSCFYFGKTNALLPAFGNFTGKCKIPVKKGDRVFVITNDKVIEVK